MPKLNLKKNFPILARKVNKKPLTYLDSGATSQKPQSVIDAISDYYQNHNANVHRGVHMLSDESTTLMENSRTTISSFFGADPKELIFVRNATEAMNGVAYGWAARNLSKNDVIITTLMEHHANVIPWQEVARNTGAKVEFVGVTKDGKLDLDDLAIKLKQPQVKLVAFTHVSNTLGTVNPTEKIISLVKKQAKKNKIKIRILIDGAQSAPHMPINFQKLGADFYVFSGHKMLGPMGIGGLLVKKELLTQDLKTISSENNSTEMRPWLFGGGMISEVHTTGSEFHPDIAERFVPGTPDVASIAGLAAACEYLGNIGMENVLEHDLELVDYALNKLRELEKITILGPIPTKKQAIKDPQRVGSVTFLFKGAHAHDVAQILNSEGVAVRSGHHCTMPLHTHFGWVATVRASFNVYNTKEDIDVFLSALEKVEKVLKI